MLDKPVATGTDLLKTSLERGIPLYQVEEMLDAAENRPGCRGTESSCLLSWEGVRPMFRWLCLIVGAAAVGIASVLVISWIMPHSHDCCEGHSPGSLAPSTEVGRGQDSGQRTHSPAKHAAHPSDTHENSPDNLTKLSPADRLLVEKQGVCPISGRKLASMGAPHPLTVKGRTVFLCCPSCDESFRKEPDRYLGKRPPNTT